MKNVLIVVRLSQVAFVCLYILSFVVSDEIVSKYFQFGILFSGIVYFIASIIGQILAKRCENVSSSRTNMRILEFAGMLLLWIAAILAIA